MVFSLEFLDLVQKILNDELGHNHGVVDLTGDEDLTDEDGDTGMGDSTRVSVSLGGEIFLGRKGISGIKHRLRDNYHGEHYYYGEQLNASHHNVTLVGEQMSPWKVVVVAIVRVVVVVIIGVVVEIIGVVVVIVVVFAMVAACASRVAAILSATSFLMAA
ncbi:hypothetical protein Tco_1448090 [Tanacetum coccineum]